MVENATNPTSSWNKGPQAKPDRQRAWIQLTVEYLRDLPQQLGSIRNMVEVKDYPSIKQHAHRAKGTSATYRLSLISKNFAQLEILAESQNPNAITAIINEIMQLVELQTRRLISETSHRTESAEGNTNG